jgi:hypothetical protein
MSEVHHFIPSLIIVTFLEVTRRPWEDMEIISAVFSGLLIREGFGK